MVISLAEEMLRLYVCVCVCPAPPFNIKMP